MHLCAADDLNRSLGKGPISRTIGRCEHCVPTALCSLSIVKKSCALTILVHSWCIMSWTRLKMPALKLSMGSQTFPLQEQTQSFSHPSLGYHLIFVIKMWVKAQRSIEKSVRWCWTSVVNVPVCPSERKIFQAVDQSRAGVAIQSMRCRTELTKTVLCGLESRSSPVTWTNFQVSIYQLTFILNASAPVLQTNTLSDQFCVWRWSMWTELLCWVRKQTL